MDHIIEWIFDVKSWLRQDTVEYNNNIRLNDNTNKWYWMMLLRWCES